MGRDSRAELPLSKTHQRLLEMAENEGWGELDNSAIIRVFRERLNQDQ